MQTILHANKYVTTFHTGQNSQWDWMAWTELNGKVIKKRFCLNRNHAERTRKMFVINFWGNTLN